MARRGRPVKALPKIYPAVAAAAGATTKRGRPPKPLPPPPPPPPVHRKRSAPLAAAAAAAAFRQQQHRIGNPVVGGPRSSPYCRDPRQKQRDLVIKSVGNVPMKPLDLSKNPEVITIPDEAETQDDILNYDLDLIEPPLFDETLFD